MRGQRYRLQGRDETYFSCNEKHLLDNLKYIHAAMLESINRKKEVAAKHKLDVTQSLWRTAERPRWVTPWDAIITEFHTKMGSMELFCWTVFQNAVAHKKLAVNEQGVKGINVFLDLFGGTAQAATAGKRAIAVVRRLVRSSEPKKKLLALELALALATASPVSFWHAARWRAAVFILDVLDKCLATVDKVRSIVR